MSLQTASRSAVAIETSPTGVFAERLEDGHFHYGVVFPIPDGVHPDTLRKRSKSPITSRHGSVEQWTLTRDLPGLRSDECALLVPRSWLIRRGFLSPTVALCPSRKAVVRRWPDLQQWFWIEAEPNGGQLLSQAA